MRGSGTGAGVGVGDWGKWMSGIGRFRPANCPAHLSPTCAASIYDRLPRTRTAGAPGAGNAGPYIWRVYMR